MADVREPASWNTPRALIGAGLAVAAAGAAGFLFSRKSGDHDGPGISDAPDHVRRRGGNTFTEGLTGTTVLIDCPPEQLFAEWRDFTRFPRFMENVERVEKIDGVRSRWMIKTPAGTRVELVTRITGEVPGKLIAWSSEPGSRIRTDGRIEFLPGPPGRGTMVRLMIRYDHPGGILGKGIARLFERDPDMQTRRDLRRFKQLMETGEVSANVSPSARAAEALTSGGTQENDRCAH